METKEDIIYGVSKYNNINGVTCYMNSILHILQQTPIFIEYISQAKFRDSIIKKNNLKKVIIYELFRLFKVSLENDDSCLMPSKFRTTIGEINSMWTEHAQQDSQEFFSFLISQIKEDVGMKCEFIPGLFFGDSENKHSLDISLNNIIAINSITNFLRNEYSPLNNLFDGFMKINKKCEYCSSNSMRYEPFLTLGVSIPINSRSDLHRTFTIEECLNHLIIEDQLDDENRNYCGFCGLKNKSINQSLLWKTPKILVIHIKRFLVNSFGIPTQKINNNVIYPIQNLDMSKYFDSNSPHKNNSLYNLFGINIHLSHGGNINRGHYISIVKNMINHNWYLYNDSSELEKAFKKEHLQNSNAYMLFYCRAN